MNLYSWVLTIHILSAVIGIGPAFAMPLFTSRLRTPGPDSPAVMSAVGRMGVFPSVGLPVQLLTGFAMGIINPAIWDLLWPKLAMLLLLVALVVGAGFMSRLGPQMGKLLPNLTDTPAHGRFAALARRLHGLQLVQNAILALILLLMILKPF